MNKEPSIGYLISEKGPHDVWKLIKKLINKYPKTVILSKQLCIDPFFQDVPTPMLWEDTIISISDVIFIETSNDIIVIDYNYRTVEKISI